MLHSGFELLNSIDEFFWKYIGFIAIIVIGIFLTLKSNFLQFRVLLRPYTVVKDLINDSAKKNAGTNPFKLYFASIGGMVGLGNISAVVLTVTVGGPGGLVWLWLASLFGMLVKYAEIYLGITYRVKNNYGGFDGGPMYYLKAAFGNNILPVIYCLFLCIYSTEIYQFTVLTDTISSNFDLNRYLVLVILLTIVMYSAIGGVPRLANICTTVMPLFLVAYLVVCTWIIVQNFAVLQEMLPIIISSAFSGHAAVGGFAGSTIIIAIHQGASRAVYSGDIGIGYDSIVQSETRAKTPKKQAKIAIIGLFSDTIICTLSCLIVLVTGLWKTTEVLEASEYIPRILAQYFPYANIYTTLLMTVAALSTIIGYMVVGLKSAKYINGQIGEKTYLLYSIFAFIFFSFFDQSVVLLIMSISTVLLMVCNIAGIIKLSKDIKF